MADFYLQIRDWYRLNGRKLPWRDTKDPFKIWLSEIILQQTRVDQGMSYYLKFTERFPDVSHLAAAEEQEVLNLWQGLGYYSRARNLHFAANQIVTEHNGEFPNNYKTILTLKGVGSYTAAAIASFAFGEAQAVVDGNVYRVLSRVFDIETPIDSTAGKKEFQQLADELLSKVHPDEHNQAIMELGALICTPTSPNCAECPLFDMCLAKANNTINKRPVKAKKTKVTEKYFHYLVAIDNNKIVLEQRNSGIWKNMYQFPVIETTSKKTPEILKELDVLEHFETLHILSHQKINAFFYRVNEIPSEMRKSHQIIVPINSLDNYPIPRLIDKYLEQLEL